VIAIPSAKGHIGVVIDRIDDGLAIDAPRGRHGKKLNVGVQLHTAPAPIRTEPRGLVDPAVRIFEVIPVVLAVQVERVDSSHGRIVQHFQSGLVAIKD